MLLTALVYLAACEKSFYKPSGRAAQSRLRQKYGWGHSSPGPATCRKARFSPLRFWDGTCLMTSLDSFKCCKTLKVGSKTYAYYSLPAAEKSGLKGISRLPFSLKVLLENLLRNEDGKSVTKDDILAFATWLKNKTSDRDVA